MKRLFAFLAFLVFAPIAYAQTPTHDCITTTCDIISDPFPPLPSPQPVSCELLDGTTSVATTPVAGPAGAVYCLFTRNFSAGNHSLTARAISADGFRSPASNAYPFVSSAGAPPAPTNLRKR